MRQSLRGLRLAARRTDDKQAEAPRAGYVVLKGKASDILFTNTRPKRGQELNNDEYLKSAYIVR